MPPSCLDPSYFGTGGKPPPRADTNDGAPALERLLKLMFEAALGSSAGACTAERSSGARADVLALNCVFKAFTRSRMDSRAVSIDASSSRTPALVLDDDAIHRKIRETIMQGYATCRIIKCVNIGANAERACCTHGVSSHRGTMSSSGDAIFPAIAPSIVSYDTAAWSLAELGGMIPPTPLDAARAARIAAHATTPFVDAVRVFGALTHFTQPLDALLVHGWTCSSNDTDDAAALDARALLQTDRAGCRPWIVLALRNGALCAGPVCGPAHFSPINPTMPAQPTHRSWLLVHCTHDNKRCMLEVATMRAEIVGVHSILTGEPKRDAEWIHGVIRACTPSTTTSSKHQALEIVFGTAHAKHTAKVLLIERGVTLFKRGLTS